MDGLEIELLARALLIVLASGLAAGLLCQRLGISLLIGYLLVGAVIGEGGLRLVAQHHHELEYLARAGILLLLFAIGIEFSLDELVRLSRFFLVGGGLQMSIAAAGAIAVSMFFLDWRPAVLIGTSIALSSTVLVFRALAEIGESSTPHGKRAIGILLFQDVALVPLMLIVPLIADAEAVWDVQILGGLALKSLAFVGSVLVLRVVVQRWTVPVLARSRSRELVVLFAVCILVGMSLGAGIAGLPPALGAFAAGLILSGNRLTAQTDALILPYRELFAVVFFVVLGTLIRPALIVERPIFLLLTLVGVLVLKTLAAFVGLRATGLSTKAALGTGLGLSQLGEFAFVLFLAARSQNGIPEDVYEVMLLVGMLTMVLTPVLIRWGRSLHDGEAMPDDEEASDESLPEVAIPQAVVIGAGPIGRQVTSQLECTGTDVCVVDLSPVNLHEFALVGIRTVAGDAIDPQVLRRAGCDVATLCVVSVPNDDVAVEIVGALHRLNPDISIVVRCRYRVNVARLKSAGALHVVSEESQSAAVLVNYLQRRSAPANSQSGAAPAAATRLE